MNFVSDRKRDEKFYKSYGNENEVEPKIQN